jgi:hypothetical protein
VNLYSLSEGKRSFVRPRCRWELNFKMDIEVENGSGLYILGFVGLRIFTSGEVL